MYSTAEFRKGLKIEYKGEPFVIVEFQHHKPGKGGAFMRTRLKNLITGRVLEETFRSGEKVGVPDLQEREVQYIYQAEGKYHFMDQESYEELALSEEQIAESKAFLQENVNIKVLFYQDQPIAVDLPTFAELRVAQAEPGLKGDTATGGTKPATLDTGAVVQVPLFINEGDVVRIDTRTGQYIERVK
ncbi:MAG: elongation factor P [Pseudomonadota bacterium]